MGFADDVNELNTIKKEIKAIETFVRDEKKKTEKIVAPAMQQKKALLERDQQLRMMVTIEALKNKADSGLNTWAGVQLRETTTVTVHDEAQAAIDLNTLQYDEDFLVTWEPQFNIPAIKKWAAQQRRMGLEIPKSLEYVVNTTIALTGE